MAATLVNTLYPPLMETFMPSFFYWEDGAIYYTLSPYNSAVNVAKVHVYVVEQATNKPVLIDKDQNHTGNNVYITDFNAEIDEETQLYKIVIPKELLKPKDSTKASE